MDYDKLEEYPLYRLKDIAKDMSIKRYSMLSRQELIDEIKQRFREYEKYRSEKKVNRYKRVEQLGVKGKEGTVYLVKRGSKEYAMKMFSSRKSGNTITREAELQKIASDASISPKVIEFNAETKFIVMERMHRTLLDILGSQKGVLKRKQQKEIIDIFKTLDDEKVFHSDPSVLNFLEGEDKRLYIIDFGFARAIDNNLIKKHNTIAPNIKFMVPALVLKLREVYPDISYNYLMRFISDEDLEKYGLKTSSPVYIESKRSKK